MMSLLVTAVVLACQLPASSSLEGIRVSNDRKGFVLVESGKAFTPWGFNYDHDGKGRLIEDYWDDEWPVVVADFREMRELGANVVRIHLQFGAFMETATEPRQHSLDQLARLVKLAEESGVYLDVTGLGCYHKQEVPAWYDRLDESGRWQAQGVFWEAVAKICANSTAIFCYDLMNEPVVHGGNKPGTDWLGPGFAGKHFVQYITLDRAGRERADIAKQWVDTLVAAIRKHDKRHLITVGLVPWSLDRPGLTSGFVPAKISENLDFIAVHIYPERDKEDEALETLEGFAAVGKPVVIEEIFPLKCSAEELGKFIARSRPQAAGWIGFYWGQSLDELRSEQSLGASLTRGWLELFAKMGPEVLGKQGP